MTDLIGHEGLLRELHALAGWPDPPHALLLAGPESTGRTALALAYARLLNCERRNPAAPAPLFDPGPAGGGATDGPACGECRPCRLIGQGAHPDVITVGPGESLCKPRFGDAHEKHPLSRDIRICQVRGITDVVSRYPFEARFRLIVIDPADRLRHEAQNALLKTLEEPAGHTVIALVTAAPEAIFETILSRCRRLDVRPVARAAIEDALVARGIEPGLAARAAAECRGRPGRALAFAADPSQMGDRGRLLARCAKLVAGSVSERFAYSRELAERQRSDRMTIVRELEVWEAFWEERLREAAAGTGAAPAEVCLRALKAVGQAREDVLAQVQAQPALDLMLLSFPRITMAETAAEAPVA